MFRRAMNTFFFKINNRTAVILLLEQSVQRKLSGRKRKSIMSFSEPVNSRYRRDKSNTGDQNAHSGVKQTHSDAIRLTERNACLMKELTGIDN